MTATTNTTNVIAPADDAMVITPRTEEIIDPAAVARETLNNDEALWKRLLPPEKKKAEPVKEDKEPVPVEEKKPKAGDVAPAAPALEPKKRRQKEESEISTERMAEINARAVAEATTRHLENRKPVEPVPVAQDDKTLIATFDEEGQGNADVYQEMKRLWPDKYGSFIKDMAEFPQKEKVYQRAWEKANSGQKFDPDAEEHDEFYDVADPREKMSQREFKQAERSLIKREAREEVQRELGPQLDQVRRAQKAQEIVPAIQSESLEAVKAVLSAIKPEYAEWAGNQEKMVKLAEDDPIAGQVLMSFVQKNLPLIHANIRLHRNAEAFDANNPVHAAISEVVIESEKGIMALPVKDRFHNGKFFATLSDYVAMAPAEREKHWALLEPEINFLLRKRAHEEAADAYAKQSEWMERIIHKRGGAPRNPSPPPDKSSIGGNGDVSQHSARQPDVSAPTVSGKMTIPAGGVDGGNTQEKSLATFWTRVGVR